MPLGADTLASVVDDGIPDAFRDLALGHSNDELMALLDVDRDTVRGWRRATGLHRPRGARTLPALSRWDPSMTLSDLAQLHGWGSYCRFVEALRAARPAIYRQARDNGLERRRANLRGSGRAD
jgi:hypothetical protein